MSIRSVRLCHHCAIPLSEDECLHYVFECHVCVMDEHDLELAVRRDPHHPDAARLSGAVEVSRGRPSAAKASLRVVSANHAA